MFWVEEARALGIEAPEDEPAGELFDMAGFARRLKSARLAAGASQEQTATKLDMSQATYSRLEHGRVSPDRLTATFLHQLSLLYGRSMTWFLHGSPVRDRIRLAARKTDQLEVRQRAERVLQLMEMDADLDAVTEFAELGAPARGAVPRWRRLCAPRTPHPSVKQGRELAEQVRVSLDLGDGPIEDLQALLQGALDLDVAVVALGDGLSAVAAFDDERDMALLAVNVRDTWARQRFSFAHELAHVLFNEGHAYAVQAPGSHSNVELRADKFAQVLLLPEQGITAWIRSNGLDPEQPLEWRQACALADTYGVSPSTAWIALEERGIAPRRSAPTAAGAALVAHQLQRHEDRQAHSNVERIPATIEARALEAFRQGYLPASSLAAILGRPVPDWAELTGVVESRGAEHTGTSRLPAS